jgi:TonB family protein
MFVEARMRKLTISAIVIILAIAMGRETADARGQQVAASLGGGNMMPELGKPKMPAVADLKQAAQLDAEIVVAVTGSIAHTRVLNSTDRTGALEKACLETMRSWRLRPAISSGNPIATLVQIHFDVEAPSADGTPGIVQAHLRPIIDMPQADTPVGPMAPEPGKTGVSWPKVAREIRPSYTQEAMRAKLQGAVELQVLVLPDGTVGAARVTKGLGFGLDEAATMAARHWLFEPGKRDGQPVATQVGLVLEFRLH